MSDGLTSQCCGVTSSGGCDTTGTNVIGQIRPANCTPSPEDCYNNDCELPMQNAEWSSNRTHQILSATVHSIGFGPIGNCTKAADTLRNIAQLGGGEFYSSSNASELQKIYQNLAQQIVASSYQEQTIVLESSLNISSKLYHDSYIYLKYNETFPSYGLMITTESPTFNNTISEGIFYVPEDSTLFEANAISYSAARWTDQVLIKNSLHPAFEAIFNLSSYGPDFTKLGDPYIVNLPSSMTDLKENTVKITSGTAPNSTKLGSPYNKIIYTIIKPALSFSNIVSNASGCNWQTEFSDNTFLNFNASSGINRNLEGLI